MNLKVFFLFLKLVRMAKYMNHVPSHVNLNATTIMTPDVNQVTIASQVVYVQEERS